jgi:hypothetical protein
MNSDPSQLLAQLQDIHPAAAPGWWPPAPGWWVLVVVLLILLFFAARFVKLKLVARSRHREWLLALDAIGHEFDPEQDAHEYLASLNRLFRSVALKAFPGTACARLQGEEWVNFISSLLPDKAEVSSLSALARGPYEPGPEFSARALDEHARTWVRLYG